MRPWEIKVVWCTQIIVTQHNINNNITMNTTIPLVGFDNFPSHKDIIIGTVETA